VYLIKTLELMLKSEGFINPALRSAINFFLFTVTFFTATRTESYKRELGLKLHLKHYNKYTPI
jgi:hypothetical protein